MKINQSQMSPLSWIKGDQNNKQNNQVATANQKDPVASLFAKHQVTPTANELKVAKEFVGNDKSKMETLELAIQKGVDITGENLEAIHEALTEPIPKMDGGQVSLASQESVLDQKIAEVLKEFPELKEVFAEIEKIDPKLLEAVKHFTLSTSLKPSQLRDMLTKLVTVMKNNPDIDMISNPKAFIKEFVGVLMRSIDTSVADASFDVNDGTNIELKDKEMPPVLRDSSKEILEIDGEKYSEEQVQSMSDEEFGELLNKAMDQLEVTMANLSHVVENVGAVSFMVREEITQNMIEVKQQFNQMKVEVSKLINQTENQSNPKMVALAVEKVAEKLENLITKTDLTLYTSMREEKSLLLMSNDLKIARNDIANGNVMKAKKTLNNVMKQLGKMHFAPSKREVVAMINKRFTEMMEPQPFKPSVVGKNLMMSEPKVRNVVSALRDMGLNHESEVAERLDHPIRKEEEHPLRENLKSVLMKLENSNTNQQVVKDISKMMNHLEGQQLLNHSPEDKDKLIHSFSIPYTAQGEAKEVQVMINGKKNQFRIDEDNCSMYFAFQLDKYGEVGVLLSIKDETVSMTIKTDHEELGTSMLPLAEKMVKNQVDYGFKPGRVNVKPLNESKVEKVDAKEELGINKGSDGRMDVKI